LIHKTYPETETSKINDIRFFFLDDLTGFEITYLLEVCSLHFYLASCIPKLVDQFDWIWMQFDSIYYALLLSAAARAF